MNVSITLFPEKLYAAGKRWQKQLFTLIALLPILLNANEANAQASAYTFAASSGTYTSISGTVLNSTIPDSWVSSAITLSPGFAFNGITYTTAYMTSNGFITLGGPAPDPAETQPITYTTGSGITICPFGVDANVSGVASANSSIQFQTVGNEHVFQWTDLSRYGRTNERISIQARLNTSTGAITFVYGGTIAVGTGTTYQPMVGISTSGTDFNNLKVTNAAGTWAAPNAGTSNSDIMRFTSTATAKSPTAGQTYTFTPPPCLVPNSLAASSITTTSATVTFNGSSTSYVIEYGPIGYTPGTAAAAGATGTLVSATTSPFTLSGLTPGTAYDVYVRSNCTGSGNGYSSNAKLTITTNCVPTVVPYVQDFESVTTPAIPICTSVENAGTGNIWKTSSPGSYGFNSKTLNYSYNSANAANAWFYTRGITLNANVSYRLTYRYGNSGGTTFPERLAVKYGASPVSSAMTNPIATMASITNSTAATNTVDFVPATTGVYYLGFQCYSLANEDQLYIDDIKLVVTPTCFPPTAVSFSGITANNATVTFSGANPAPPAYLIEYGPAGFTPGTGATAGTGGIVVSATASPFTLSGLSANTTYDVYIRGNCSASNNGYSDNTTKATFMTNSCVPPTILTTTAGTSCGPGTVTLGATASTGIINWYNVATGGTSLATGPSFTTPSISTTTNYWVESTNGVTTIPVGPASPTAEGGTQGTQTVDWDVNFTVLQNTTLASVDIFPLTSGQAGSIKIVTGTGYSGTTLTTINYTTNASGGTTPQTIPINYALTPGSYSLIAIPLPTSGLIRNTTGATYPYTSAVANITGNGLSSSYYMSLYNWIFTSPCSSLNRTQVTATVNPRPDTTVSVVGATTFCQGKSVTFNAAITTGLTYQWLLNNNVIPTATTASYTANATGSYRLRVSNGNCFDTSTARTLTILPAPTATVVPLGSTTFCSNDSVRLKGTTPPAGLTYQWQLNGVNIANATDTIYTAKASGNYRLVLSNSNCTDTSAVVAVTVNPLPVITISPATAAVCSGTSITLTASGANTYSWSPATGLNTTTGASVVATPASTITYTVTGIGTNGCSAIATRQITVSPAPVVTISPATAAVCAGSSINLTASGAATYSWSASPTLNTTTGATVTATPTVTTTYTVTGDDGIGCTATATRIVTVNPLPNISIAPATATTVCEGVSTVLTASGGVSYSWSPATGLNATTGTSVIATPLTTTTYTVTGTNANGCQKTATKLITINPAPVITVSPATAVICAGSNITLTASGANTYAWSPSATLSASTGATVTATPFTTTTYNITGTSTSGCTRTVTKTVTVNPLPLVTITPATPTAICAGSNVQLNALGATTYSWSPTTGLNNPNSATVFAFPTVTTTYTVTGITNGCTGTATKTITVNPLPTATATAAGPTAFCEGGSVDIVANTGTGLTYQWRRNNQAIPGATSLIYTATQSGVYNVVVSNVNCSANSGFVNVTVSTMPVAAISLQGPATFCQGGNVLLQATTGNGYTYQWHLDGADIPGATSSSYMASVSGSYTITITSGTCVALSPAQTVSVTPGPIATITPSGPLTFCQGGMVKLTAPAGVNYTYQWYKDGAQLPGQTSASFVAATSGNYNVFVSDGTCNTTSQITTVVVRDFPVITVAVASGNVLSVASGYISYQWYRNGVIIPGATTESYTATRDGYYAVVIADDLGCSATSSITQITSLDINNVGIAQYQVKIYPNPARDVVRIEADGEVDIKLTTIDGRELISKDNAKMLDLTQVADGIYMIRIADHKTGALIRVERLIKATH